jgi:hypothetical protein
MTRVRRGLLLLAVGLAVVAAPAGLGAQAASHPTPEQIQAALRAHAGDFDYLLGQWRFEGTSKQYGKFSGYWTAVRLAGEGSVLDEYRVVGDSGQTYVLTSTLRSYDALRDQWELVSVGNPNGLQDVGTGRRVGEEVHIDQSFGVGGPHPTRMRIRYYDIGPDHFSWNGDCSSDGGRTWVDGCLRLDVHRIGPPPPVMPLTHPAGAAP